MRVLLQALWSALLAALVGLLAVGEASTGTIIVVSVAFASSLIYWLLTDHSATKRWPVLSQLPGAAPTPKITLGAAVVQRALTVGKQVSGPAGGDREVEADYVKVPVHNDLRAPVAAEDVQGWLDFRTAEGDAIAERVQARWAHTEQAPDRGPFAPLDDPSLNEVRIPAGSTRHLDVAACADELGGVRMWTNRSMRDAMFADPQFALGDRQIVAKLTVRGSNAAEQSITLRLTRDATGVDVSVDP